MQFLLVLIIRNYRLFIFILSLALLSSCATINGSPCGVLYANIKGPLLITNDNQVNQVGYNSYGISKSMTILYLVNFGDASIEKAIHNSKNPSGVKISHVDFKYFHFLGCGTYKTIVYYYDSSKP